MSGQSNPYSASSAHQGPSENKRPQAWSSAQWGVFAAICVQTVFFRIGDMPMANLGTMAALALLSGTAIRHPLGFLLPLGIRVLTDCMVHLQTGYGFFSSWPFDYTAYVLIYFLGRMAASSRPKSAPRYLGLLVAGGVGSVATYYLLSNLGVWFVWQQTYPRTISGLMECYTLALPFLKGTILGNLIAVPVYYECWYRATASALSSSADTVPAASVAD